MNFELLTFCQTLKIGFAGDHVVLTLTGPDQSSVSTGMVLCDPSHPAPITAKFLARIVVFNIETPITKGKFTVKVLVFNFSCLHLFPLSWIGQKSL